MLTSVADEEEPPYAKRLKFTPSPCGLSSLPTELVLSCLARVSISDYASLSLVSKWHRSQLLSPELYNFRSLLGCTEKIIYLCLLIHPEPNPRWFAFSPKTLNRPRRLVPIRSNPYQPREVSSVVAHGYGIYVLGGRRISGRPSPSVLFLDCRSHTWTILPAMRVARQSAAAGVVDGKIYVLGGCKDSIIRRWGEFFDPKTQTWNPLPVPPDEDSLMYESGVTEGKVFAENELGETFFYIPSERKWKRGNQHIPIDKRGWHVIEKVMYCCVSGGRIMWCEASELEQCKTGVVEWRDVMGLEILRDTLRASKLVNYGGGGLVAAWGATTQELELEIDHVLPGYKLSSSGPNMLLFWDVLGPQKLEIWCAEISLERRKTGEIWGNVEWSEAFMTLDPPPPRHLHCFRPTSPLYSLGWSILYGPVPKITG